MRYGTQLKSILLRSGTVARRLGHSYVGSGHLLIALLETPGTTGSLLRFFGMEPETAANMMSLLYGVGTPGLPLPQGFSNQARRILQSAGREARQMGAKYQSSKYSSDYSLIKLQMSELTINLNCSPWVSSFHAS